MSWSLRRGLVVLTAVAACGTVACFQTAFAQRRVIMNPVMPVQPTNPAGGANAASFELPHDTDARRHIEAAREYIDAKRWPEVAEAIQHVLNDPRDKFAPLLRKGPDGKEIEVLTSVRAEANRLLAGLPPEGLEVYKASKDAGPAAAEYLQKAKGADSSEERLSYLGLLVRNYLHTDAGGEAADLLATHFMDAGDFRTAARYYGLLLTRAGGANVAPPDALFRAAYAFRQVGDKADEDLMWQTARARGIREIKIGEETRTVSELQDYLAALAPPAELVARQWTYFGGDASHTGRGDGGPAFMWRFWSHPTNVPQGVLSSGTTVDFGGKVDELFRKASDKLTAVNQPVLSPQFPVAAYVTLKNGKKHPLVVFRTHAGVAVGDLADRRLLGSSPIDGSLQWMMETGRQSALTQSAQAYIDQGTRPGIFFENTTTGTLSIDGDFAYTVADLAVPKPPMYRVAGFPGQPQNFGWSPEIMEWVKSNRLAAFDLSAGCSSVWLPEVFTDPKSELSGCFFLGPPLAVNGKLYVLSEKQQEMRLICLENVKGDGPKSWKPKVDFVLPLGVSLDSKLEDDALRRVNAAHLSYGEGVLVCPTNLGYVVGIDLLQNSLLWAYPYRDKADASAGGGLPPGARQLPNGMILLPTGQQIQPTLSQQCWRSSAPIVQDGKVVFTAYDSNWVHCVNLRDGSPVWRRPRQEGDLYLGGVVDGKAIVVGQRVVPRLQPCRRREAVGGGRDRPADRLWRRQRQRLLRPAQGLRRRQGAGDLRHRRGPRRRRRPQQGPRPAGKEGREAGDAGQPDLLRRRHPVAEQRRGDGLSADEGQGRRDDRETGGQPQRLRRPVRPRRVQHGRGKHGGRRRRLPHRAAHGPGRRAAEQGPREALLRPDAALPAALRQGREVPGRLRRPLPRRLAADRDRGGEGRGPPEAHKIPLPHGRRQGGPAQADGGVRPLHAAQRRGPAGRDAARGR